MKTISQIVHQKVLVKPFLTENLQDGIINYLALAKYLLPEIEMELQKKIKVGSIVMALRRYDPNLGNLPKHQVKKIINKIGEVVVRSELVDVHFRNSESLLKKQTQFLEYMNPANNPFYSFIKGSHDSNLIINQQFKSQILIHFKEEKILSMTDNLNSITVVLPEENVKITGLYYTILKQLAWEGVNIYEMISTSNEFTLVVEDPFVEKAFGIIKNLKV